MQQFDIHRNEHLFMSFLGFASAFGETSGAIETKNVRALVIDEADAMPASQVICKFQGKTSRETSGKVTKAGRSQLELPLL